MLLRRFLRIRVLQAAYAFEIGRNCNDAAEKSSDIIRYEKDLIDSIRDTDVLVMHLLGVIRRIFLVLPGVLSEEKNKFIRNEELIAFIDSFLKAMQYKKIISIPIIPEKQLPAGESIKIGELAGVIVHEFTHYFFSNRKQSAADQSAENSKKNNDISVAVLRKCFLWILDHSMLRQSADEAGVFGYDNLPFVIPAVLKTMMDWVSGKITSIPSILKGTADDLGFCTRLFRFYATESGDYEKHIRGQAKNWEINRFVITDKIIIKLALCEIFRFPEIPRKAILSEYIEISKYFSTPDSGRFINGIVDKIIKVQDIRT